MKHMILLVVAAGMAAAAFAENRKADKVSGAKPIVRNEVALPQTLTALRRELKCLSEVKADIFGETIRIDGEIKSIKKWNYLMKVLKAYPNVRNFAEFSLSAELFAKMKENLTEMGFTVTFVPHVGEPNSWKANCVAISYDKEKDAMTVQANVYTPQQQDMLKSYIGHEMEEIATINEKKDSMKAVANDLPVRLDMQVVVAKLNVRLSVAYMAIGESDLQKIGNSQPATGDGALQRSGGAFDVLRDLVCGSNSCNTARVGTPLDITMRSFSQAGITRMSDMGHAFMESWSMDGVKFKSGGTVCAKVGMKNPTLIELAYGVLVNVKGGLVDASMMDLYFDFNFRTIVPTKDGGYDCREDISMQQILCPIGQTTFVRGTVDMVDKNTPPSGIRFLRTRSPLNWFLDDSGKVVSDRRVVIMVCPEIVDGTQQLNTGHEINIRVPAPDLNANCDGDDGSKKFTGFWSWLNWFMF